MKYWCLLKLLTWWDVVREVAWLVEIVVVSSRDEREGRKSLLNNYLYVNDSLAERGEGSSVLNIWSQYQLDCAGLALKYPGLVWSVGIITLLQLYQLTRDVIGQTNLPTAQIITDQTGKSPNLRDEKLGQGNSSTTRVVFVEVSGV